jgi:large subunit ribosomal protein L25
MRSGLGKKATRDDRSQQAIPCVVYGGNEVVHFNTTYLEIRHLIYSPDFKIAEITVGDNTYRALLKDSQFHPITEQLMHIDFLRLEAGVPLKVEIPIRFKGQSPGVKLGGKLLQQVRKVKVKCLPENLVSELFVDISSLELGQTTRVKNIEIPEGMELMMALQIPVASIEIPRALRAAAAAAAVAATKAAKKK